MRAQGLVLLGMLAIQLQACRFDPSGTNHLSGGDDDVAGADAATPPRDGGGADGNVQPSTPDAGPDPAPPVAVWRSLADGSEQLERQPDLMLQPSAGSAGLAILIDEGASYQEIDGFGASLTESSAWLLATRMSQQQRHELLSKLFDRDVGIGLNVLRLPIGATDFALASYSYDETPPALNDFSIDHDRQWLIPVLKEIQQINPGLHRMAAPWSPPGWMKTTGSMVGGALGPGQRGVLAEYLVDYLSAFAAEGLPIETLSVQNEPYNLPAASPGMHMTAQEQAAIIKNQLGPRLLARGLATRVLVWDHNWDDLAYAQTVLADPAARGFVAGTAFHCYGGDAGAQDTLHAAYPQLGIWLSECSDTTWVGGYPEILRADARLLIAATRHWARAVLKWNLALDETHGPQNHGCSECLGTVEVRRADGAVTFSAEYFALGHFGKFVAPGAHRVGSETHGDAAAVEHVAFVNPDGCLVLVAFNPGAAALSFEVRSARGTFGYALPAGALVTFVL